MTARTDAVHRLGITHPIIQGPFGGGLSTPELAATVSNLGGLGSYGAHILEPDEIGPLAAELRRRTSQPFALNLWVSDHDPGGQELSRAEFERVWAVFEPLYSELGLGRPEPPPRYHPRFAEQVEAVLEVRPPVFSFVFGIPSAAILSECKRRDIVTIGAATTLAEARALDEASVDLILATGLEAGGHRPSFLAPAEESLMGTLALTPLVADRVRVPVIAAGGIVDRRGIRAVLALGAQAAQLGTAFLACAESGTTDAHRAILFGDSSERTRLTRAYTGRLARGVPNRLTEEIERHLAHLPPFPARSWFVSRLKTAAATAGSTDLLPLYAGQAAPNLRHRTAADLMAALLEDASG
jgi:nitronate monooxygenase